MSEIHESKFLRSIGYPYRVLKGSDIEMQVFWSLPSNPDLSIDDIDDFQVEAFCSDPGSKQIIQKDDLKRVEITKDLHVVVKWYAYIDTNITGCGPLRIRIHASIPDEYASGGTRDFYNDCPPTNVEVYE